MKVLIIEDESRIAKRIAAMVERLMGNQLSSITVHDSLETAKIYLTGNKIDLLLLDLNLNGEDGFTLLKEMVAERFHTIIISADKEKAITAFEYGVLDFIGKPFDEARVAAALARLTSVQESQQLKFLAAKNKGTVELIPIHEIMYIKGADIYTEIHLNGNQTILHSKSLDNLTQLLPIDFIRIHKSYLVPKAHFGKITVQAGGRYQMELKNGEKLPIGRTRYEEVKKLWI